MSWKLLCISFWNFIKKIFPPSCLPCWLVRLLSLFYETALVHIVAIYLYLDSQMWNLAPFLIFDGILEEFAKFLIKKLESTNYLITINALNLIFFLLLHHLQFESYSCNKITTTWIQISRQNWNGFFSKGSHQIIII